LKDTEKDDDLKLAPQLAKAELHPNTYQKMKVTNSRWVLSESCAVGLKFIGEERNDPSFKTTAWFLSQIDRWYSIMTSTHPFHGLSAKNFAEKSQFLNDFMDIIRGRNFLIILYVYYLL